MIGPAVQLHTVVGCQRQGRCEPIQDSLPEAVSLPHHLNAIAAHIDDRQGVALRAESDVCARDALARRSYYRKLVRRMVRRGTGIAFG
jgi:hypothetical protein|eukprot:COSAG02_NODE_4372_length_5441_cov_12.176526_3_plen_88_part_00